MEKTWKPTVAGTLDIVAGSFGLFVSLMMVISFVAFPLFLPMYPAEFRDLAKSFMPILMIPRAIFMFSAGILAIVGSAYALRRKKWKVALAGSIAASFALWPLGIAAVVFTALSKNEFEQHQTKSKFEQGD